MRDPLLVCDRPVLKTRTAPNAKPKAINIRRNVIVSGYLSMSL